MRAVQLINSMKQFIRATMINSLAGFVVLVGLSIQLQAQDVKPWEQEKEGEIQGVEIEIVRDKKITLPRANRNFQKVAPRPYEPIKPAITYELKNLKFTTPDYKPTIRPLKLKNEELSRIYGNYVSAGLGNYASYFVEGSITTKRDKNKFMGAHFYNRTFGHGPVDGSNSAASNTNLQVFGKSMGRDVTLSGDANYENRGTYFYGYTPGTAPDRDNIRQTYTQFGLNVGIENTKPADFNYGLKVGYSNLKDHYEVTEDEVSIDFNSSYNFNEKSKFLITGDYFLMSRKSLALNYDARHVFRLRPAYQFSPVDKLIVTAGANIAYQNDIYPDSKTFHFYPHLKAQYELTPSIEVYGLITGDVDRVSLHTLSAENLWVSNGVPISNTNRSLEFSGGISGKIGSKVSFGAGLSVAALKNYYFYQFTYQGLLPPSSVEPQTPFSFTTLFDGNTKRFNPYAQISFAHSETASLSFRADYFSYGVQDVGEAFNRPTYRLSANSKFNIYDKISLDAGFIAQGGMKALDATATQVVTLDPAFDLNMKARYFISKQVSAFVQLNNLLSNNYPIYQSYPARGFQALVGVSWGF
ncbi:hypothetical protein BH09BAC3_BH09BAC3_35500 [soil metagenome]